MKSKKVAVKTSRIESLANLPTKLPAPSPIKNFYILNGPNLNMLGLREKEIYGSMTLADIQAHTEKLCAAWSKHNNIAIKMTWQQSNHEGEMVDLVQGLHQKKFDFIVINPAAYSHTSVALLDALLTLKIPIAEVHLSNPHARADVFRHTLLTAKAASLIMGGLRENVYFFAIQALIYKYS